MENKIIEKEILKIHHDKVIEEMLKDYPLEKGYDVTVTTKSIDSKTERITFDIQMVKQDTNIKVR